jgi:hypothetical protein
MSKLFISLVLMAMLCIVGTVGATPVSHGWLYGKPVLISIYRVDGLDLSGIPRPNASLDFIVAFNKDQAGCGDLGYCDPGADISWYVNGTLMAEQPWTGENHSLGGYFATFHMRAPESGLIKLSIRSKNMINLTYVVEGTE